MSKDSPVAVIANASGSSTVEVTDSGSLRVDSSITNPPASDKKVVLSTGDVSGVEEEVYTITTGKTLVIQQFSGGGEVSVTGNRIALCYRPTGDPASDTVIDIGYASGSSFEHLIGEEYVGDGVGQIVLKRTNFTGGRINITGRWIGYERTT